MIRVTPICISVFVCLGGPAAADVCVSCAEPAAVYDCTVKKADEIRMLAGDKAIAKVCTSVLRKKGPHASCKLVTGSCPGAPTVIGWKEVKAALAAGLDEQDDKPAKAKTETVPADTKPPLKETSPAAPTAPVAAAKQTEPAQPKMEAAPASAPNPAPPAPEEPSLGDKIKTGAEKSWKCVSSFFGEC